VGGGQNYSMSVKVAPGFTSESFKIVQEEVVHVESEKGPTISRNLGARICYPMGSPFIYSVGDSNEIMAQVLFGKIFGESLHYIMRKRRGSMILLVSGALLFFYLFLVQWGIVNYEESAYLLVCLVCSAMAMPGMLLLNAVILYRLYSKFDVQFYVLNMMGLLMGLAYMTANVRVRIVHTIYYLTLNLLMTILDAAINKRKTIVMNMISVLSLLTLQAMIYHRGVNDIPELEILNIHKNEADQLANRFGIHEFTSRCITNMIWLCIARVYFLYRSPNMFFSLDGPMISTKDVFGAKRILSDIDSFSSRHQNKTKKEPMLKKGHRIAINVEIPFEYNTREVLGRTLLGADFADRFLYKRLQRMHTSFFLLVAVPYSSYAIYLVTTDHKRIPNAGDVLAVFLIAMNVTSSFLFTNPKIIKRCIRSFELLLFSLSVFSVTLIICYVANGSYMTLYCVLYMLVGLGNVATDAHSKRFGFSVAYTVGSLYLTFGLLVAIYQNAIDFKVDLVVLGFKDFRLKSWVLGWIANILFILIRNIYTLLRFPDCFIFFRSSVRVIVATTNEQE